MKWPLLILALVAAVPLAYLLRRNPHHTSKVWTAIGLLLFLNDPLHLFMAVISWQFWPGFVKGFEVSLIDILAMAIYISLPHSKNALEFRGSIAAYLSAVGLSVFQAGVPEAALFYVWQLCRMFFFFAVVAKSCRDERTAFSLLKGMAIGICFEAIVVVWQRLGLGELQTGGTFGHQNSLGLVTHFVVFPYFALLLAGLRGWEPFTVPLIGAIVTVFTVSRATLGLSVVGYAALFVLSASRKWTRRKAVVALLCAVCLIIFLPLSIFSLQNRFAAGPASEDYDERAAFERAATAIVADHPMGIGANNYVVVANTRGYNERAGVIVNSLAAHVHNVYLVVAAETGYLGLLTFVILLAHPVVVAFAWGWRNRGDVKGDLLLGLGISLIVVYVHSFFEWVFVTYYIQYFFASTCGLIAGVARQLGYGRTTARATTFFS